MDTELKRILGPKRQEISDEKINPDLHGEELHNLHKSSLNIVEVIK
jgi:hypothetical protein